MTEEVKMKTYTIRLPESMYLELRLMYGEGKIKNLSSGIQEALIDFFNKHGNWEQE